MSSAHKYSWTTSDGRKRSAYRALPVGPDGKQRGKRGFDRKGDALDWASDREAEARHGITIDGERPSGRTTVEVWTRTWLTAQEVRPSTAQSYKMAVKRINAAFGGRSLASIRPTELRTWRSKTLGETYAASTAAHTAAVFAMVLKAAVQDRLIERSPMPPARHGSVSSTRVVDPDQLLTPSQIAAWAAGMAPKQHPRSKWTPPAVAVEMPLVAARTGLRKGELLGLRLEDVDFLRREIRVDHQLLRTGLYGPTKTAAGNRTIPLTADVGAAINRHLLIQPAIAGEPIFRGVRGRRWTHEAFRTCWERGRVAADLPEWVHWHALRDVYASTLIRSGLDLREVMTLLGHTSSEETLRTYARLWPDSRERAREALEAVWIEVVSADERQQDASSD